MRDSPQCSRLRASALATATSLALLAALPAPTSAAPVTGSDVLCAVDADFDSDVPQDVNDDAPNNNQLQAHQIDGLLPLRRRRRLDARNLWFGSTSIPAQLSASGRRPLPGAGTTRPARRSTSSAARGCPTGTKARAAWVGDPRDNDGLIATSRGLGDIRPWTNAGGADGRVVNYARVTGSNTRTVAVDAQNRLWTVGQDLDHELLAADGTHTGTQFNVGCGGYGGLIDNAGTLWSARNAGLLRYDLVAATGVCHDASHSDYGLDVDPVTGEIWHTNFSGNRVAKLAADGTVLGAFAHGSTNAQGVAVDRDGNVWVARTRSAAPRPSATSAPMAPTSAAWRCPTASARPVSRSTATTRSG